MNELDRILSIWRAGGESGSQPMPDAVLTTVVHVKGSAYRRPGARMLVLPDGRRIGSISGGCLEGDVSKKAWWFTEGGKPSVRIYDTSSEDDAVWEFGLGCNGVVHVMFERLQDSSTQAMLSFVADRRARRSAVIVATVVGASNTESARLGDRLLFDADGIQGGSLQGTPLEAELLTHVRDAFLHQKSHLAHLAGCDVFIEWIGPPVPVVVFGAGHDALPFVKFAKEIGWHVTVADGRANYAKASRFPEADKVVLIDPAEPLRGIEITRETMVVMMTHNYPQDAKLLRYILPAKPRYLGMLGPRSRTEDLLEEVGLPVTGIDLHAPVGLDLGGDTPESIALSIVAEIQSVLAGRAGGMLKHRQGSIHPPAVETGIESESIEKKTESAICELV